MLHGMYQIALIVSLVCLGLIDRRWKVAWYDTPLATRRTVLGGLLFFIIWDAAGIMLHIFYTGSTKFLTGIFLAANFPIEEVIFLILLMYTSLLTYRLVGRKL